MNTSEYWQKLAELIEDYRNNIPIGDEPYIAEYPGGEAQARTRRAELEAEHASQVDKAIRTLFAKRKWPRTSSAVKYYTDHRFAFASATARMLSAPHTEIGTSLVGVARGDTVQLIEWLCIDVWHQHNEPPVSEGEFYVRTLVQAPAPTEPPPPSPFPEEMTEHFRKHRDA
jgi:hypothetical protein